MSNDPNSTPSPSRIAALYAQQARQIGNTVAYPLGFSPLPGGMTSFRFETMKNGGFAPPADQNRARGVNDPATATTPEGNTPDVNATTARP